MSVRALEGSRPLAATAALAAAAAAAVLYGPVSFHLVRHWLADENYAHGLIVAPLAVGVLWTRRHRLAAAPPAALAGPAVVTAALLLLVAGTRASELYLPRISGVALLAGTVLWLGGHQALRASLFPLALLTLTIPLPSLVFARLTGSLQQQAAALGARLMELADVSVLRQGNVLVLPQATLEVVDACSGIRSLFALLTMALLLGHWRDSSVRWRAVLVLAVIPVVLLVNAARVAFLGWSVGQWGPAALDGPPHALSGYATVACGALLLYGVSQLERGDGTRARGPHL